MALPKRRHSHARTHKRRAHDALNTPTFVFCSHCNAAIAPHSVCDRCGYYKDEPVMKIKEKKEKKTEEEKA
jgi:large subunit ribosomal protein L32